VSSWQASPARPPPAGAALSPRTSPHALPGADQAEAWDVCSYRLHKGGLPPRAPQSPCHNLKTLSPDWVRGPLTSDHAASAGQPAPANNPASLTPPFRWAVPSANRWIARRSSSPTRRR
jgi:hypothetical protein